MATGVGKRIKEARKAIGLSQEDLAKRMGLKNKSSICKVERGDDNLTTDSVQKYADALHVSVGYLMGWEGNIISGHSPEVIIRTDDIDGTYTPYTPEELNKAIEIYKKYVDLIPEIRSAVDGLLNNRSDS